MLTFVLLPGWGFRTEVMAPLRKALKQHFPAAEYYSPTTHCSSIQHESGLREWRDSWLPIHQPHQDKQRVCYIGWSLGGLLASRLAALPDGRTKLLMTLGTNKRFVADKQWACAMPRDDFEGFMHAWKRRPQDTLRHFSRMALQGCPAPRELRASLPTWADENLPIDIGTRELEWLEQTDLQQYWINKQYYCSHLFAENDVLVPSTAAEALQGACDDSAVITGTGHLFPVTHASKIADYVASRLLHGRCA